MYREKPISEVLAFCVGDTIGRPRRTAFPIDRAALERNPRGKEMFALARAALEAIATIDATYAHVAKDSDKFCRGYGLFQYDLQSFETDPEYFLSKRWTTFEGTVEKCVIELKAKLKTVYGAKKASLTHAESVYVAIAYNNGRPDLRKDFKQGYKDASGMYYGEKLDAYLTLASSIP